MGAIQRSPGVSDLGSPELLYPTRDSELPSGVLNPYAPNRGPPYSKREIPVPLVTSDLNQLFQNQGG